MDSNDDAIGRAISTAMVPEGMAVSEETVASARVRAEEMLRGATEADRQGFKEIQQLSLSMGLPAAQAMLRQIAVAHRNFSNAIENDIKALQPEPMTGCMEVNFYNQVTKGPDIAYLVLGECPRDHNFGAQLDRLRPLVAAASWPKITNAISAVVHFGRLVWSKVTRENLALVERCAGARDLGLLDYQVDRANTTLFIDAAWPRRIGVFVRLSGEEQ